MSESSTPFLALSPLTQVLDKEPESCALGSEHLRTAALNAVQFVFDLALQSESHSQSHVLHLLSSLDPSIAPQTRSQARANAIKRSPTPPPLAKVKFQPTPIPNLFIEGMNEDQIWEQLDLRARTICEVLEFIDGPQEPSDDEGDANEDEDLRKALENYEQGEMSDDGSEDALAEDMEEDAGSEGEDLGEDIATHPMDVSDNEEDDEDESWNEPSRVRKRRKLRRRSEIDDDFFDLAEFNAETEQAEAKTASKGRLGDSDDESDDDVSIDLFAPVEAAAASDEVDMEKDAGEALYADFFEAPSKTTLKKPKPRNEGPVGSERGRVRFHEEVRVKKIRPTGKNLSLNGLQSFGNGFGDENDENDDNEYDEALDDLSFGDDGEVSDGEENDDMEDVNEGGSDDDDASGSEDRGQPERARIDRLKNDLFAEEEETPERDMSTHEKRILALKEQISELESENVGKKDWVLMGEASSKARPQNSLLEEDLEFERVMKPVPVVTEETVQALEDRIKARILEGRFDDVVRLRATDDKPFLPSRFLELKDTKSTQSLAQIYEGDYVASQEGGVAGDDRDGKLKKEHDEITQLWEGICGKLDALCNAHFIPKQPKAIISTISNVASATLESTLPTTKSAATMLAPEEVLAPSTSAPRARSEMTPAEKQALRVKERKAKKKARDSLDKSVDKFATKVKGIGGVKRQKKAALESVVKSGKGVTVVGKTPVRVKAKASSRSS